MEDRSVTPALKLHLAPIALDLAHYSSAQDAPLGVELKTGIGASGQFSSHGSIVLSPLRAALDFSLSGLDLPALQPYVAQATRMTIYRGRLASDGHVEYAAVPAKAAPRLKLQLGAQVTDLATRDNVLNADFISWRALRLVNVRFQQQPDALEIARISLNGANARVIIGADSQLNVVQILSSPGAPPPSTPATTPAPTPASRTPATAAMPIRIGRVDIEDSATAFSDQSVQPNFSAAILGLHGSIVGLSSDPAARATVELDGSVDQYAPVSIKGEINPLAATSYTDIGLSFRNIELTTFNPYSGKFAGYSIAQGKLTTELHYHVENRKLRGDPSHRDRPARVRRRDRQQAGRAAAIKLAVSPAQGPQRRDRSAAAGDGSLDDPSFHIAPVVWKLLEGLVRKIVTAPFALLGSLFGGGEELAFVDFPAGSAILTPEQGAKLPQLAKALIERPQLKLDIPLHAQNGDDDLALEHAALEQGLGSVPPRRRGSAAWRRARLARAAGALPRTVPDRAGVRGGGRGRSDGDSRARLLARAAAAAAIRARYRAARGTGACTRPGRAVRHPRNRRPWRRPGVPDRPHLGRERRRGRRAHGAQAAVARREPQRGGAPSASWRHA